MIDDDGEITDERLRLILLCCHPALGQDAQVALTLRLVGGLTTPEIAAAFLTPEATLAQRIVRAKRKIRDAAIAMTIPADLDERLGAVLAVLYLVSNEGYLGHSAEGDVVRVDLADEAIRLTRVVLELVPDHPEALGLLALQLYTRARAAERTDRAGDLVLLADQDRSNWDLELIGVANGRLATAMKAMQPGAYQLQATIASFHANARTSDDTDWSMIASLYGQLRAMTASPVVALNHAVAVAMADGPLAGLRLIDEVADALADYHLLHSTRAELLLSSDDPSAAAASFDRALELVVQPAERRHLERRRAEL